MLLSLNSKGSAILQHRVKFVSMVCEREGENTCFQCNFGLPGSAPLAENCPGELGWVEESEPIFPRCQKPFVVLSCEISMQCGLWMSSRPGHPVRAEWEAGGAWEQLPSLGSAGS